MLAARRRLTERMATTGDNMLFSSHSPSRYNNGRLRCGLVNIQFYFTDVGEDEGGIIFVPGQHKHLRTSFLEDFLSKRLSFL